MKSPHYIVFDAGFLEKRIPLRGKHLSVVENGIHKIGNKQLMHSDICPFQSVTAYAENEIWKLVC